MAPFQKSIEGEGIALGFDGHRAVGQVLGGTLYPQLVGHRFGAEPKVYTLHLTGYDDVKVLAIIAVRICHLLILLRGQKYVQIGISSNPRGGWSTAVRLPCQIGNSVRFRGWCC